MLVKVVSDLITSSSTLFTVMSYKLSYVVVKMGVDRSTLGRTMGGIEYVMVKSCYECVFI